MRISKTASITKLTTTTKTSPLSEEDNFVNKVPVYEFEKSLNDIDSYNEYVNDELDDGEARDYSAHSEYDTNTVADDYPQDNFYTSSSCPGSLRECLTACSPVICLNECLERCS